jgi:hypothetical protein
VPAAPVVAEAPPAPTEAAGRDAAAPAAAAGRSWSWAALLGLAGGFFLSGGTAATRDRRRPRLPEAD